MSTTAAARLRVTSWALAACAIAASLLCAALLLAAAPARAAADPPPAFPGAQGWAAHTPGGRGGRILRVTTLAADGPGSFAEAVATPGPRIVVFEVGGVIDLGAKTLRIVEPYLTIAGQTAPPPGITFVRGGIDIATHDVIVRHIRVRPGDAGLPRRSGTDFDAISTVRAHDVIVDHCSLTWGTDEGLSASGTRFVEGGRTLEDFRAGTSRRITFSNNLIAEGLANSTHAKGEHSKGTLIHDHVQDVLIVGNLYAHNFERNPLFKGATSGQVINNLIYNPGARAVHYNLIAEEWIGHDYAPGSIALRGNVLRAGHDTRPLALFMLGGSGDVDLYLEDNLAVDLIGEPTIPEIGRYTTAPARVNRLRSAPPLPFGVAVLPSAQVQDAVIANAGATPWNRDPIDRRIVADVIEGRGDIIDSQDEVGGYPDYAPTRRPFVEAEWNLDTLEPLAGFQRGEPLR
ncbi:pectate lyase family protein [Luteimonas huabeiensis]|uniref:pectate lyase family protein n=1 Tax=Luteimonas huabeiensis TaxID=1244513 RepID=UPI0004BCA761|nr:pectate lyase [Luteimonas huabeiensis]